MNYQDRVSWKQEPYTVEQWFSTLVSRSFSDSSFLIIYQYLYLYKKEESLDMNWVANFHPSLPSVTGLTFSGRIYSIYVCKNPMFEHMYVFVARSKKNARPTMMETPTLFLCDLRRIPVKFHSIRLTASIWPKNSINVNCYTYWSKLALGTLAFWTPRLRLE